MAPRSNERAAEARGLLGAWLSTVLERTWVDPAFEGRIYGSGYSAWGLWAQINVAFVLASSRSWPRHAQEAIRGPLRDPGQRSDLLDGLLRYVVGSHTTGRFDTVGGGRWGSRRQPAIEDEHFENWHSPIWVATLAQIAALEPALDQDLSEAIWAIVAHDAAVQASLPIRYLDGRADSHERHGYFTSKGGLNSHAESNAWKGSLLSLARFAAPSDTQPAATVAFERTLWLSSSACPSDVGSTERGPDGELLERSRVGTHLSDSGAVIHHGVLHPCYSVFALFSRMQTHELARAFDRPYPEEAERREETMLATLLKFVIGGRLVYPAGQDWPRWVYGQCYLAPVLAHQQRKLGTDLSLFLDPAVDILLREAQARQPHLLGGRFEHLESRHGWHYDRYEADLAFSLTLTAELLERTPTATPAPRPTVDGIFFDASAETALVRRDDLLISVSARTLEGPFQILAATASSTDILEWNRCGSYRVAIRDLPDLAVDTSSLESFAPWGNHGFDATIQSTIGTSPQTDGLLELVTTVRALPVQRSVMVMQRLTARRHTTLDRLELHCWRFSHGQSGDRTLSFTDGSGSFDIVPGTASRREVLGSAVHLRGGPSLVAPSTAPCAWQVRHHPDMADPMIAVRWTEVSLPVPVDPAHRFAPGDLICEIPVIVTFSEGLDDITFRPGAIDAFGLEITL